MPFAERFGWTLLVSCVLGVLLILIGDGIPNAWGITLQELAQGEKREKAETGSFLAWLREFLGYVTSSFLLEGAWLAIKITVLAMAIGRSRSPCSPWRCSSASCSRSCGSPECGR